MSKETYLYGKRGLLRLAYRIPEVVVGEVTPVQAAAKCLDELKRHCAVTNGMKQVSDRERAHPEVCADASLETYTFITVSARVHAQCAVVVLVPLLLSCSYSPSREHGSEHVPWRFENA